MNRFSPLISTITTAIDDSDYLSQAITSLLTQDVDYPLEVIIVWDTAEPVPLPKWSTDPRIVIAQTGRRAGTPRALNHGISCARGDLIARLDHDDLATPERLSRQVAYMQTNPDCVALGTFAKLIDHEGEHIHRSPQKGGDDLRHDLLTRNMFVHSSLMYRRDVLFQVGLYNPRCARMQDYELMLRMAAAGRVAVIEEELVAYRIHSGQHSRNTNPLAPYTREILRRRSELASELGESSLTQTRRDASWLSAQFLRHWGLRPPGYLKGATP